MDDTLKQLNLNKFMISNDSPLTKSGNTNVYWNQTLDNVVGAASFAQGRINATLDIGAKKQGYIRIDGPNIRIIINDGTVDRAIFGFLQSGF